MSKIYKYNNKRFIWRPIIVAHLLDEEDKCQYCSGTGRVYDMWDGNVECNHCYGRGKKSWGGAGLTLDQEYVDFLQKKLDEYIEEKIKFANENPPFLGMNI